jgi:predicted aspartyl protease
MFRYAAIAAVLVVVLPGPPSFALTAKDKMATCKFGADNQNLQGAARNAFMRKCTSNEDEPRYERGAEKGKDQSRVQQDGVPHEDALKRIRLAAEKGDAKAQYRLGEAYRAGGLGLAQNYAAAVNWIGKAADQGDAEAQYQLGVIYSSGDLGTKYYAEALKWFRLAEKNGGYPIPPALLQKRCEESNYTQCEEQKEQTFTLDDLQRVGGSLAASVPMQIDGGAYAVPVRINDAITLNFVVDSGAADVSIPADVVMTLMRTGTLKVADFLGEKTYALADGSTVPSQTFRIRSLKVGNNSLENVLGSIASVKGGLLLGQSFLSRFKSWSIDNTKHELILTK